MGDSERDGQPEGRNRLPVPAAQTPRAPYFQQRRHLQSSPVVLRLATCPPSLPVGRGEPTDRPTRPSSLSPAHPMDGSRGSPRIRSTALAAGAGMHYDLAVGDQGELWEWHSQEYDLQQDLLAAPCSSLWDEASNNVGDDWSMFDEQTPIKHCTDFEFQFCGIGETIVKDFEEGKETLQAKRRRMLQFCPENAEMTCPMTEDGLSESLQEMDFSGTDCLLNSDGIDELTEEWLVDCSQDVEPCLPAEEMNSPAAATEKAVDISVHSNSSPCQQSMVVHNNPPQARPTPLKAGRNIIGLRKERTAVAFPFELIKPCSLSGNLTLNDINKKIRAPPPYKIRHKSDEEAKSLQASSMTGKPVVNMTKIHTEGGKGSITITRTRG